MKRIPSNIPLLINGLVSLGSKQSDFYWWHPGRKVIYFDQWTATGWAPRVRISEKDLPEDCKITYENARELVRKGKEILSPDDMFKYLKDEEVVRAPIVFGRS